MSDGSLLQEEPDKTTKRIGHWSQSLANTAHVCDTTQQEFLAIVWATVLPRPFLEGTALTFKTDKDSLKWMLNLTDASGRLEQWRVRLFELDFDVSHQAGVKHEVASAVSRLPPDGEKKTHLDDDLFVRNVENIQVTNDG